MPALQLIEKTHRPRLRYAVVKTGLKHKNGQPVHAPTVKFNGHLSFEEVCRRACQMHPGLSQEMIQMAMNAFGLAAAEAVADGFSVSSPLGNFSPALHTKGSTQDQDEVSENVRVDVNVKVSKAFLEHVREVCSPICEDVDQARPELTTYINESGSDESGLTPGGVGHIRGNRLNFHPGDADQGLYLINIQTKTELKVERFLKRSPSEILFKIPANLTEGTYRLEIRRRRGHGRLHKAAWKDELKVKLPTLQ